MGFAMQMSVFFMDFSFYFNFWASLLLPLILSFIYFPSLPSLPSSRCSCLALRCFVLSLPDACLRKDALRLSLNLSGYSLSLYAQLNVSYFDSRFPCLALHGEQGQLWFFSSYRQLSPPSNGSYWGIEKYREIFRFLKNITQLQI